MVLLDTGTPGTSREIYSEDAESETRTGNPWIMTYFAIICNTKKFQANFEVSEVLITYVTNRGKSRVMLHIKAGHS